MTEQAATTRFMLDALALSEREGVPIDIYPSCHPGSRAIGMVDGKNSRLLFVCLQCEEVILRVPIAVSFKKANLKPETFNLKAAERHQKS